MEGDFDEVLRNIAKNMTDEDVDNLGPKLGFGVPEIKRFKQTNLRFGTVTTEGNIEMLRKWRNGQFKANEKSNLRKAMVDAGLRNIADQFIPVQGQTQTQIQASSTVPSASVAESSSSSRVVTDKELLKLAGLMHVDYYIPVAVGLELDFAEYDSISESNQKNKTFKMLQKWKAKKGGGKIADLDNALDEADCGSLISKYKVEQKGKVSGKPRPPCTASHAQTTQAGAVATTQAEGAAPTEVTGGNSKPVTDDYLNDIVEDLPNPNYSKICKQLGWGENRAQNELEKHSKDYAKAYRAALQDWKNRDTRTKQELIDLLKSAGYNLRH